MKIKTRESLKTIKTFDRAENLAGKTKNGISELNKGAEETREAGYTSGTEYAGNQIQGAEETGTRNALYGANRIGRWGVKKTRRNIQRWKSRKKKPILSKQKELPAPKRQIVSAPKTAKATLKTSQKVVRTAKVAAKATVQGIKVAGKATVTAVKGIVAAIAAGGWIAIVVIVAICTIAMVVGTVFSFFIPVNNDVSLNSVIFEVENQLAENIEQRKYIYSCETVEIRGEPSPWKEVLAIYIAKYKVDGDDMDSIISFNEKSAARLKQVYNDFNNLSVDVQERTRAVTHFVQNESGKWVEITEEEKYNVLIVTHSPATADEIAKKYGLNKKKKQTLKDLLNPNFDDLWNILLTEME